jgi:DNA-binding transcriptional MerR regulator
LCEGKTLPAKETGYSINELAKRARVSVRTIRFYIDEGLLPAPDSRGRYAVYGEEYLDRLELIRRLKDSFLPLKEIRVTLSALSWAEVQASLADLRKKDDEAQIAAKAADRKIREKLVGEPRSSAAEYIADLLSSKPVNRPLPPQPSSQPAPVQKPGLSGAMEESWQRIQLAPGLELHIRQTVQSSDQQKIEQIVRLAKKLFSS